MLRINIYIEYEFAFCIEHSSQIKWDDFHFGD